jgi:hypothetical protein
MDGLDVKRIGPSYVVQINFRSPNAEQGVKIANTVIDGYIFDQLNASTRPIGALATGCKSGYRHCGNRPRLRNVPSLNTRRRITLYRPAGL